MKVSELLLGVLLLPTTPVLAQIDSTKTDSVQLKTNDELEKRVLEMGYEKRIKSIDEDGKVTYEYVRQRRYCPTCGMG